jgi:hypothetical protein
LRGLWSSDGHADWTGRYRPTPDRVRVRVRVRVSRGDWDMKDQKNDPKILHLLGS